MNTQRMPGFGVVMRAQLELLLRTKYVIGFVGLLTLCELVVYALIPTAALPPWEGPGLMTLYVTLLASGGLAGALVWFNEGPQKRRYHWAMPVKREVHDAARVIAGAVWLILIIAVFCVIAWFLENPVTREHWLRGQPLFWASLFVTPLLAYLLITIPCMALGRPLMAILFVMTTGIVLSLEQVGAAYPALGDLGKAFFSQAHPPSLGAAIGGGALTAPWTDPAEKQRVYLAVSETFWKDADVAPSVKNMWDHTMLNATVFPAPVITKREWLASLALWYVIALLGIAFAVKRRPDV